MRVHLPLCWWSVPFLGSGRVLLSCILIEITWGPWSSFLLQLRFRVITLELKRHFFPHICHICRENCENQLLWPFILPRTSFHLSLVHSLINLFTHPRRCYGYEDPGRTIFHWLAFISRARSFRMQALILSPAQRQSSLWVHGKVKTTSHHSGKRKTWWNRLISVPSRCVSEDIIHGKVW